MLHDHDQTSNNIKLAPQTRLPFAAIIYNSSPNSELNITCIESKMVEPLQYLALWTVRA